MSYRQFTYRELNWIKKFKKIMNEAPLNLFMFVGSGEIIIYSERKMDGSNGTGVNQDIPNVHVPTPMDCDGGDW